MQDQILDHLKEVKSQKQVLSAYTKSLEPRKVKSAVLEGREDTDNSPLPVYKSVCGVRAYMCVHLSNLYSCLDKHKQSKRKLS